MVNFAIRRYKMSLPDRNNPYTFNDFLEWRKKANYYDDDPFFQKVLKHFTGKEWPAVDAEARRISEKASYRWRDLAESIARIESRP